MNTNELLRSIRSKLDDIQSGNQEDLTKSKVCEDSTYLMHVILVPFGSKGGMVVCVHSDLFADDGYLDSANASREIFPTYAEALNEYERTDL